MKVSGKLKKIMFWFVIIGITPDYWSAFCPGMREQIPVTPGQQPQGSEAMYPVMVLLLQRENAAHNVASLVEACMIQLAYQGVLGKTVVIKSIPSL